MGEENLDTIIKFFIDNCFYDLLYDENEMPNISFDFKEEEARDAINKIIIENIEVKINEKDKIYKAINNVDYNKPVVEIKDYKLFFYSINKYVCTLYNTYMNNCYNDENRVLFTFQLMLKYIWLRMTPEDFKNPENFFIKNIEMIENNTFNEYYNNDGILLKLDDKYQVGVRNRFASTFDEENKEIELYIKSNDNEKDYLPVIRYGIYKKDGKTICEIGSIQTKNHIDDTKLEVVNDYRRELNRKVPGELKQNVEPRKVLALILFIKLLQDNNIDEISIPSMYVLDYDFHYIMERNDDDVFNSHWTDYLINLYRDEYEIELHKHLNTVNKVDIICNNKSTDYIKLFERLLYHLPDIKIIEYPGEVSNYMRISLPKYNITQGIVKKLKKS